MVNHPETWLLSNSGALIDTALMFAEEMDCAFGSEELDCAFGSVMFLRRNRDVFKKTTNRGHQFVVGSFAHLSIGFESKAVQWQSQMKRQDLGVHKTCALLG